MSRQVVGILGGMGPEATILLQQRLLNITDARDDADHLPLLIDMNPQVPSRIAHLIEGTGSNPGPVLAEMAQRLETAGATALAMPCNTAHHYAPFVNESVAIPLLNMINLSTESAVRILPEGGKIGILASPAVQLSGVFSQPLEQAGLTELWPEDSGRMLDAIRLIKAQGAVPEARETLLNAARELTTNGAECLFVACSEFSLIANTLPDSIPVIDTIDVLAAAIHNLILNETS